MPWGALIGAAGGLLGNIFGGVSSSNNAAAANAANLEIAEKNIAMQREFAQHGIRWKVEDARQAGLHPLIGAGATPQSFAPVSYNHTSPDTSWMGNAGQHIGRAVQATMTREDRALVATKEALTLNRMGLENELLRSQIQATLQRNQLPPAMPGIRSGMGGQGQGINDNLLGVHEPKPAEHTTTLPGQPSVEAGPPRPVTQWGVNPDGGFVAYPTNGIQALSDDGLYQAEHFIRNRVSPQVFGSSSSARPPLELMARRHPGATGVYFDEANNAWYPLYAGEYETQHVRDRLRHGVMNPRGAGTRVGRWIR